MHKFKAYLEKRISDATRRANGEEVDSGEIKLDSLVPIGEI